MTALPKKTLRDVAPPVYTVCWQLVMYIINRWSTVVPFHISPGRAGVHRLDEEVQPLEQETVWFFVPKDATHRFEIISFLDQQANSMRRDSSKVTVQDETTEMFGTEVNIYPMLFDMPLMEPYLTEQQRLAQQHELFKHLQADMKEKGSDEKGVMTKVMDVLVDGKVPPPNPEDDAHRLWGIGPEDMTKHLPEGMDDKDMEDFISGS